MKLILILLIIFGMETPTQDEIITATADYTNHTVQYIENNLVEITKDENDTEGTISFTVNEVVITYNWRTSGGSNVIVIWPT
jgi:glucosamine 6-phosphate synthetase-like amidotransferase/phosphosugar isomerase protein